MPRPLIPIRSLRALLLPAGAVLAGCQAAQVRYAPLDPPPSDPRPVEATVFLLGDGGAPTEGRDAVLAHLRGQVDDAAERGAPVLVAYLGDNIYEVGARPDHAEEDRAKLAALIEPLGTRPNVRAVFLPGNHDWGSGASLAEGRRALRTQEAWLTELAAGRRVDMLPSGACPGPATVALASSVHVVLLDTEWLLRGQADECGTPDDVYRRLEGELAEAGEARVLMLAHHPMDTGGRHAGHVAPLQGFPTVTWLAKKTGVERQDLTSGAYAKMVDQLEAAFRSAARPPLAFAGGHDHSLQVLRSARPGAPTYHLVSGSAAKSSAAGRAEGTRYATNGHGYMRLDFRPGEARLVVFAAAPPGSPVRPVFWCDLAGPSADRGCPEAPRVGDGS